MRARTPARASSAAKISLICRPAVDPAETRRSNSSSLFPRSRVPSPSVSRHPRLLEKRDGRPRVERQRGHGRIVGRRVGSPGPGDDPGRPAVQAAHDRRPVEEHRHRAPDAAVRKERRPVVERDVVVVEVVELDDPAARREAAIGSAPLLELGVDPRLVEVALDERPVGDGVLRTTRKTMRSKFPGVPGQRGFRSSSIDSWVFQRTSRYGPFESGARLSPAFRKFLPAKRLSGRSGNVNAKARSPSRRRNRARKDFASIASTVSSSANSGLKTGEGTFGSAAFRIVKTASAEVTGVPSSQTAFGARKNRYSRPSAETSQRAARPGTRPSRASTSRRGRERYWRTCCSGRPLCSTAFSVVGSPTSRRRRTPPAIGTPSRDSSRNPRTGSGATVGVGPGARASAATSGSSRARARGRELEHEQNREGKPLHARNYAGAADRGSVRAPRKRQPRRCATRRSHGRGGSRPGPRQRA